MHLGAIVLMVIASVGCLSTAPYDGAHLQRVADINARYQADADREQQRHAAALIELAQRRAALRALSPSSLPAPAACIAQRDPAIDLAPRPSAPAALCGLDDRARALDDHARALDDHARALDDQHRQALHQLERARLQELTASRHRRDAEIDQARVARRARVRAAAAAMDRGLEHAQLASIPAHHP